MAVLDLIVGREVLSEIEGYDRSFALVFFADYSGYNDYEWKAILEKDGQLFFIEGGYSPGDESDDIWNPEPINEMNAFHVLIDVLTNEDFSVYG